MQVRALGLGTREYHREGRLPLESCILLMPTTILNFIWIFFYSYSHSYHPSYPFVSMWKCTVASQACIFNLHNVMSNSFSFHSDVKIHPHISSPLFLLHNTPLCTSPTSYHFVSKWWAQSASSSRTPQILLHWTAPYMSPYIFVWNFGEEGRDIWPGMELLS